MRMVSWSAGMAPPVAFDRQAANAPSERSIKKEAHARRAAEMRRDQAALGRKLHLDDVEHAFVGVDLGGALRRGGERAQRRRQPLAEIAPVSLVERPVDRPLGLRIGAGEVQQDLVRVLVMVRRSVCRRGSSTPSASM